MPEAPLMGFGDLVDLRCEERPDVVAVDSVESGPFTWSQLRGAGIRAANELAALGVGAGEPVLTMLPADFDNVALWAGCARLRAVEVPVNHAYRGVWLRGIVERIGARVAVIDARHWENWAPLLGDAKLDAVVVSGDEVPSVPSHVRAMSLAELFSGSNELPAGWAHSRPEDLAIITHTSGTTGMSKGVMLPWSALWFRLHQKQAGSRHQTHDSVCYAPFGPFHWTGRGRWYEMACYGTRLVTRHQFKTDQWLSDVRRHGVTITALVGSMPRFIENTPEQPDDVDNPLQLVNMGPVLPDVDHFKKRFGVEVAAAFAMTEIPYACVTLPPHVVSNETALSCGVAAPDVPLRVVDADGDDLGPGEIGELLVGGDRANINLGYYNLPDASEKAWEGGWFHTGDLFRYDDAGRYFFVDRAKDALRRRGENISSMEIETVINAHPAVSESAIIGVPSEYGEDEIKAVVVLEPGGQVDPADLIAFIRPQIAEFAVPRYVRFVDELPKTVTMKVQKAVLRDAGITPDTWDRATTEPELIRGRRT